MYNPKEVEEGILKFWEENKVFDKLRKKNKNKEIYSFFDGPITANNPMGVHHAWGRTYKDVYQRWKAMQGFDQRYQNGFDCQGLWVGVEVEKDLGLNSKKDIEAYGLDKFSLACRERVNKFSKIQTQQSIRLGQWMDWDNSYYTMDDYNIEHIWYFLSKCKEKNWLYKGTRVMQWCYRCGTSLSQHELIDSYREIVHPGVFIQCKIKGRENEYLLIWTTTAWTLTANVAAAVNPDFNYSQVSKDNKIFYLAEGTLKNLRGDYIVLDTIKGLDLVGLEYESPYQDLEIQRGIKHTVISWENVGEEEGTGIVHIAPGCGAEDNALGKKHQLKEPCPLDENGNYVSGYGWLTGKNVKGIANEIINDLDKKGFLFKVEDYKHRYPVCWRCGTEIVFRLVNEWFISCDEIRPLMKRAANNVTWYPEHIGKLMQDWLDNMGDWCISRKRYWGLPMPVWVCENNHETFISTKKELEKKAISGLDQLKELHRPWIDNVKIKCDQCKKEATRIKEVGDCWLDAGIVPFSTLHYLDDNEYWKKWFPAELVSEMREQVRLWFYSMLFMAVTLENRTPYLNVLSYEKVHDELGRPMHKSWGNAIWFDEAVDKMGADVMRWIYTKVNPSLNMNFGYTIANEAKVTLNMLINLNTYLEQALGNNKLSKDATLENEDRWILSKLNRLIRDETENLEGLKPQVVTRDLEEFFTNTLSKGYIQLIRDRVQQEDGENKEGAIKTLYEVNLNLLKLMSPFVPFLAEELYQKHFRKHEKAESIFLMNWPEFDKDAISNTLEDGMKIAEKVMQAGLALREKNQVNVRWPLRRLFIALNDDKDSNLMSGFVDIIKNQLNVKEVVIEKKLKHFDIEFDYGKLCLDFETDKELEIEGYSREVIRRIQNLRKKSGLRKEDKIELNITSKYDLSKQEKEIKARAGAKTLEFNSDEVFRNIDKFKVRDHEFNIGFNIVK